MNYIGVRRVATNTDGRELLIDEWVGGGIQRKVKFKSPMQIMNYTPLKSDIVGKQIIN